MHKVLNAHRDLREVVLHFDRRSPCGTLHPASSNANHMPAEAVPWTRTEPVRSRRRRFPSLSPSPSSPPVSARPCRAQPCASSAAPGCSGTAAGDGSGGYRCDLLEQTRSSPLEASKRSCRRPLPKTTTTTLGSSSSSSSKREHPANLKSSYAKRNISGLVSRERGVARMAQAGGRRHLERDCRMGRYLLLRGRRLTSRKRARGKPAGTGSYYRME